MSLRNNARIDGTETTKGTSRITIGDAPLGKRLPFGQGWLDSLWQMKMTDAESVMNEVLRCLNTIQSRKPFDREIWTGFAELGQAVLSRCSLRLREAFFRVTSYDKKRRIDALQVCHSRMSMLELLAGRDPALALRKVARELSTLPFEDTFVKHQRSIRSFSPTQEELSLYAVYRMNLEILYAQLVQETEKGVDRDIVLWGVTDAARSAMEKCMCETEQNGTMLINGTEHLPEEDAMQELEPAETTV